ncbi:MAG: kynureninase [Pirellulaceae bacterium]
MNETEFPTEALQLDAADNLNRYRNEFFIPVTESGNEQVYFVGNSLGLQPRQTADLLNEELENWRRLGVRGHFTGRFPWMPYHEFLTSAMAFLVGARDDEVVMMNSLTANLHLMMATFYRPNARKRKILIEGHAFPSDHYAVESQIRWHGLDPNECLVVARPEPGSELFSMDELCNTIETQREELALVMLPGVQYYTGQVFDIERLTQVAHANDVQIGFDLAHAAGNLRLHLHDWGPDFAVWCSYKYLNAGPGSVGGCFVHQRHIARQDLVRLAGWWGHDKKTRFLMGNEFHPIPTAEGWQLSNPPILSLAAIRASLDVFRRAGGMEPLSDKTQKMNQFFTRRLSEKLGSKIEIITPPSTGCQLSLKVNVPGIEGRAVKTKLDDAGIETDWREPNVIRAAPVPLYNRFSEIDSFVNTLENILS